MCKYRSKDFRVNNHFILYDDFDNIICYFDNFKELSKYFNYRLSDIVRNYNKYGIDDMIKININNCRYNLFTFID